MFVGVLVLVDVFTLSLWTGMDSQSRTLQNGTLQVNNSILVNLQIHNPAEFAKKILTIFWRCFTNWFIDLTQDWLCKCLIERFYFSSNDCVTNDRRARARRGAGAKAFPPAPRPPHTHIFSEIIIKEVVIKFFGKCVYLYNATVLVFSPVHNK